MIFCLWLDIRTPAPMYLPVPVPVVVLVYIMYQQSSGMSWSHFDGSSTAEKALRGFATALELPPRAPASPPLLRAAPLLPFSVAATVRFAASRSRSLGPPQKSIASLRQSAPLPPLAGGQRALREADTPPLRVYAPPCGLAPVPLRCPSLPP